MAASEQVAIQEPGQPGSVARPAVRDGVTDGGRHTGTLPFHPGTCRAGLGHRRNDGSRDRSSKPALDLSRVQSAHCRRGGGQVVVQQPGNRLPLPRLTNAAGGETAGISTQQVVQCVPARAGGRRLDQVRTFEHLQQPPGVGQRDSRHGGGRVRLEVWPRVQAQQREAPDRVVAEMTA
jgi:hypothetical protein